MSFAEIVIKERDSLKATATTLHSKLLESQKRNEDLRKENIDLKIMLEESRIESGNHTQRTMVQSSPKGSDFYVPPSYHNDATPIRQFNKQREKRGNIASSSNDLFENLQSYSQKTLPIHQSHDNLANNNNRKFVLQEEAFSDLKLIQEYVSNLKESAVLLCQVEEELSEKLKEKIKKRDEYNKKSSLAYIQQQIKFQPRNLYIQGKQQQQQKPQLTAEEIKKKQKDIQENIYKIEQLLLIVRGECDFINLNVEVLDKMEALLTKRYKEVHSISDEFERIQNENKKLKKSLAILQRQSSFSKVNFTDFQDDKQSTNIPNSMNSSYFNNLQSPMIRKFSQQFDEEQRKSSSTNPALLKSPSSILARTPSLDEQQPLWSPQLQKQEIQQQLQLVQQHVQQQQTQLLQKRRSEKLIQQSQSSSSQLENPSEIYQIKNFTNSQPEEKVKNSAFIKQQSCSEDNTSQSSNTISSQQQKIHNSPEVSPRNTNMKAKLPPKLSIRQNVVIENTAQPATINEVTSSATAQSQSMIETDNEGCQKINLLSTKEDATSSQFPSPKIRPEVDVVKTKAHINELFCEVVTLVQKTQTQIEDRVNQKVNHLEEKISKIQNFKDKCQSYTDLLSNVRNINSDLKNQLEALKIKVDHHANMAIFHQNKNEEIKAKNKKKLDEQTNYFEKIIERLRGEIDSLKNGEVVDL